MSRPGEPDPAPRYARFVADLLNRMTLEEKIGQLIGVLLPGEHSLSPELLAAPPGTLAVPALPVERSAQAINEIQRLLMTETRLGIPALPVGLAGPIGATRFPAPLARAASWNPALVAEIAAIEAAEARAAGVAGRLGPSVALASGELTGAATPADRSFGGAAALAACLVLADVLGAQGRDPGRIGPDHVAATAIHLGASGQQLTAPSAGNADQRTLRSQVLIAAEAAVRAGVAMVMPSAAANSAVPTHLDPWLLRTVLREEWAFGGPVLAAPGAIAALVRVHRVAADLDTARAMAWESGIQVAVVGIEPPSRTDRVAAMVRRGMLPGWLLDDAVAALLTVKLRLGLWDAPPTRPGGGRVGGRGHRAVARRAVVESLVLLTDPAAALPLRAGVPVQVWAPHHGPAAAALTDALAERLPGSPVRLGATMPAGPAQDVLVAVLDGDPGEAAAVLARLGAAGRPVVALVCGSPTARLGALLAGPVCVLLCWSPPVRHADAVADVLAGVAEPQGRLPVELTGAGWSVPLGHGNGYTRFEYADLAVTGRPASGGAPVGVGCRVTNTGRRAGREVVQVYLRDRVGSVVTPERVLAGFAVVELPAGATRQVTIEIPAERFAVWDRTMRRVVEAGEFDVLVGRSIADIRLRGVVSSPAPGEPAGHREPARTRSRRAPAAAPRLPAT